MVGWLPASPTQIHHAAGQAYAALHTTGRPIRVGDEDAGGRAGGRLYSMKDI